MKICELELQQLLSQNSLKTKESEVNELSKQKQDLAGELEKSKQASNVTVAAAPALDDGKLKELEDALAEKTEQNKKLEENVESMKKKNNVSTFLILILFFLKQTVQKAMWQTKAWFCYFRIFEKRIGKPLTHSAKPKKHPKSKRNLWK